MTEDSEALMRAFLNHTQMEEVRAYVERGCRFEALSVDDLNSTWAVAFEVVCAHGDRSRAMELHDLAAELRLRGLDKPAHLVSEQAMKLTQQRIGALSEGAREAAKSEIAKFLEEMDKPRN